jgi:periplasmic mercuric ion binding protein
MLKHRLAVFSALAMIVFPFAGAFAQQRVVILSVPGMTCPSCPITVSKALNRLPGVHVEGVDLKERRIKVAVIDSRVTVRDLTEATNNAGFSSSVVKDERHEAH